MHMTWRVRWIRACVHFTESGWTGLLFLYKIKHDRGSFCAVPSRMGFLQNDEWDFPKWWDQERFLVTVLIYPMRDPSGNPRKFRHGIYLVYTWYILLAFVILVYTRYMTGICFLGKSICVYHWMHVCMQWLLPKYTIHRALDGDLFSKSYIEFNISMVYDRHLLGIHLVYTTFVLVLILSE
jgi:hypothetical protein